MKIVVLDGYAANPGDLEWSGLEALGKLTVYERTPRCEILERVGDADAVFTNKTELDRELILAMPKVRFIGVLATGYNVVDVKAAREKGITVCNIPAYSTDSVAQLVFALLLELCHHVGKHNEAVQQGRWSHCADFCFWDYPLIELAGKTIGIIGYGRIGRKVADIARAFGMNVLATSRHSVGKECVTLDELLQKSDVISLHCPLTDETRGLVCADTIAKMKDGVMIINTSRGPVINESDLRDALLSGKVFAAAADVVSREPISEDNPLLGLDNCILTPHFAWAPKESRIRLMNITVDNLKAFIDGKPVNVVS